MFNKDGTYTVLFIVRFLNINPNNDDHGQKKKTREKLERARTIDDEICKKKRTAKLNRANSAENLFDCCVRVFVAVPCRLLLFALLKIQLFFIDRFFPSISRRLGVFSRFSFKQWRSGPCCSKWICQKKKKNYEKILTLNVSSTHSFKRYTLKNSTKKRSLKKFPRENVMKKGFHSEYNRVSV